ncbi:MAG TPA: aminotransferase class I/II-fold pyridoxal phosphate-dependent enzyme [Saprospiraceae bacterium]|nr:aminotransferase class I/II-fold pyridoxal phosphate-dependent enzyme [Saprospiraceae bacterium]
MSENYLSKRAQETVNKPARVDLDLYFEATSNQYHKEDNPEGRFPVNVAENKLTWSMLAQKMQQITRERAIPEWVAGYENPMGADSFRAALASFMGEFLIGQAIEPETLGASAGLSSVIELTALSLANPGDTAIIPAPAYPVYTSDIGAVAGVRRYDLPRHRDLLSMKAGLEIEITQLEEAKKAIESEGSRLRMIILTTPDNPTGGVYAAVQLERIADWCEAHKIHMIVSEIYGLSVIDTAHPAIASDYEDQVPYLSFGQIMVRRKSPFLHLWYAFSKDLGISGFRMGFIHSYNEDFLKAYSNGNLTRMVSNYAQWVLQEVLLDRAFMADYLARNKKALTEAYIGVVKALREVGVPYYPSRGSLFIWMDLSGLLSAKTDEAQRELWLDIYHTTGILLTPADGFGHREKGWYRMVISYLSPADQKVAMERLQAYVSKAKG